MEACSEKHLHRYLAEFGFRYNNRIGLKVSDWERSDRILKRIEGKRLTYRRTDEAPQTYVEGEEASPQAPR